MPDYDDAILSSITHPKLREAVRIALESHRMLNDNTMSVAEAEAKLAEADKLMRSVEGRRRAPSTPLGALFADLFKDQRRAARQGRSGRVSRSGSGRQ